jgi:hypothetical protein
MFAGSTYFKDLSSWKLNNNCNTENMFMDCPLLNKAKMLPQGFKK